jgi:hypothetical protein
VGPRHLALAIILFCGAEEEKGYNKSKWNLSTSSNQTMEAEKMCPKLKMKHVIKGHRFYTMIRDTSLSYNHDIPKKCYMVNLHQHQK